jgi:hypothetical protein
MKATKLQWEGFRVLSVEGREIGATYKSRQFFSLKICRTSLVGGVLLVGAENFKQYETKQLSK